MASITRSSYFVVVAFGLVSAVLGCGSSKSIQTKASSAEKPLSIEGPATITTGACTGYDIVASGANVSRSGDLLAPGGTHPEWIFLDRACSTRLESLTLRSSSERAPFFVRASAEGNLTLSFSVPPSLGQAPALGIVVTGGGGGQASHGSNQSGYSSTQTNPTPTPNPSSSGNTSPTPTPSATASPSPSPSPTPAPSCTQRTAKLPVALAGKVTWNGSNYNVFRASRTVAQLNASFPGWHDFIQCAQGIPTDPSSPGRAIIKFIRPDTQGLVTIAYSYTSDGRWGWTRWDSCVGLRRDGYWTKSAPRDDGSRIADKVADGTTFPPSLLTANTTFIFEQYTKHSAGITTAIYYCN